MSNWLEPAWACAAIVMGSPEIGTAAAAAAPAVAVTAWVVTVAAALIAKFGRSVLAAFTTLEAVCKFDELSAAVVEAAAPRAVMRSILAWALVSGWGAVKAVLLA